MTDSTTDQTAPAATPSSDGPILLIGGRGKTGRRIAERLAARGLPLRIASREGAPPFDWADPAGWPAVLEGCSAVYVAYAPDLAVAGAPEQVRDFARAAATAKVERLVLLSGRGEPEAQRSERMLETVGLPWTVLRCSWFNQNFSENPLLLEALRAGELALPVGPVGEPFVDVDDIAEAAVEVLTRPGHAGRIYELTGPRLLTFAEAVGAIARATGRPMTYRQVPAEAFAEGMAAAGVPADLVALLLELFTKVLDGRNAFLTTGVQELLGRPPRDFAAYAGDTAASGAWSTPLPESVR